MDSRQTPRPRPPPPLRSATSGSISRISTVSDFTDLDNFQDDPDMPTTPLQGRPSLVSLQSDQNLRSQFNPQGSVDNGHTYPSNSSGWTGVFTGYTGASGGYQPVQSPTLILPPSKPARSFAQRHQETIPEEEDGIDLGLIRSAEPIGRDDDPTPKSPPGGRISTVPAFDVSSVLGPTTQADEAFIKTLQAHEAQGKLTGGLGLGIRTDMTVSGSALLATTPIAERPLSRTFSRASKRLSRADTVKKLAQYEANKRGEVIEVVMDSNEDDEVRSQSKYDLSVMSGPDGVPGQGQFNMMRQATFPTAATSDKKTQIFYPQPNWKPFSMRWPFLLWLVIMSIILAVSVEVLYRQSTKHPLVEFKTPDDIPAAQYFAFKFLPMLIAVTYGVMFQATNFDVMRLEPFYQLSKEGGALADESINIEYLTQFMWLRPFRSLHRKHYAVAISSTASLLANTLVPTLGAASLYLSPNRATRRSIPNMLKKILIHHIWSRMLITVLLVIALLAGILFYTLQTRKSGLLADVKGIAGLASMATVSHILMDFKDMDVATHQDIHDKLKTHRYVLRNSSLAPDDLHPGTKKETEKYNKNHLSANPQSLMLRPMGAIPFIASIVLFCILLLVVLFSDAAVLTDRAPWVITALAVAIKLSWGALETDVRLMEPYYILSRRHAPPKTLTLDYTAMPFGWVAVQSALNKHWVVFIVGFGTVLTEILTVLVTSLATIDGRVFASLLQDSPTATDETINSGQETIPSFWISLGITLLILVYMGVVAGFVFVKRREVFLPRQPNTIASVLAYIHQSKMLYDFVGTNKLGNKEMVRVLEEKVGKRYGLGWFRGRDGRVHCGVDEEELLSDWRRGYDYSLAGRPWEEEVGNWL
ncbi:hypothetical protein QBC38DRAFT_249906 [Podospora fimiseda]|uniref:DUF3433 domain protein n=1 Tax=Podospora fimiseda TaxID=252190 RepID=A0AAN7BM71_9PEZI|nr:hypothetical protein QBC38DRAFT_249906 [Podospora fimiseda]